jgi:hypothetical protein
MKPRQHLAHTPDTLAYYLREEINHPQRSTRRTNGPGVRSPKGKERTRRLTRRRRNRKEATTQKRGGYATDERQQNTWGQQAAGTEKCPDRKVTTSGNMTPREHQQMQKTTTLKRSGEETAPCRKQKLRKKPNETRTPSYKRRGQ